MPEANKKVSERDKLITRPSAEPLPTVQDPKEPRGGPANPKPDTEQVERSEKIDYTA